MSYPENVTRGMVDVMKQAAVAPQTYSWAGRDAVHKLAAMRCESSGYMARDAEDRWVLTEAGAALLRENGVVL